LDHLHLGKPWGEARDWSFTMKKYIYAEKEKHGIKKEDK